MYFALVLFFSFSRVELSHLSRFASSSLGGKTGLVTRFTSSSSEPREETPSVLALVHVGSLVNIDRSCWVRYCCSVPVVQVSYGLCSAS